MWWRSPPVLRHRMAVSFAGPRRGPDLDDVIDRLIGSLGSGMEVALTAPPARRTRCDRSRPSARGGRLPPLLVAAERVAVTVDQGVHGRRRAGQGENFWQFRQYSRRCRHPHRLAQSGASQRHALSARTNGRPPQSVCVWASRAPVAWTSARHCREVTKRDRADAAGLALAASWCAAASG